MTNNKSITIVLLGSKGKGKKSFCNYIFNHNEKNLKNQAYERCTENIICYKEKNLRMKIYLILIFQVQW